MITNIIEIYLNCLLDAHDIYNFIIAKSHLNIKWDFGLIFFTFMVNKQPVSLSSWLDPFHHSRDHQISFGVNDTLFKIFLFIIVFEQI